MYNGEYWVAVSEEPIEAGETVEVVGKERMVLKVRRKG
jgi:membrane-bound ClpP family serine protease